MINELFVEDIGGIWKCGSTVKFDLVTIRPDAPPPGRVLVCRLVAPPEDLRRIAAVILDALAKEHDLSGYQNDPRDNGRSSADEIILAQTE
jgi:hypothetical protein